MHITAQVWLLLTLGCINQYLAVLSVKVFLYNHLLNNFQLSFTVPSTFNGTYFSIYILVYLLWARMQMTNTRFFCCTNCINIQSVL